MPDAIEGLALLLEACGGNVLPVEAWSPYWPDEEPVTYWPRNDGSHLTPFSAYHEERWSAELLCGLPRQKIGHHPDFPSGALSWPPAPALPLLWARTESKVSAKRLVHMRTQPSILLREGDTARYVAFWILRKPLTHSQLERANKRIAHYLRTPKKWSDADTFTFPLPGTFLRRGRTRPVPVVLESMSLQQHTAKSVVGWMRDAPDPDAWRK